MAIRSDNRPGEEDVSFWLEEKSDSVLCDACRLVDMFRLNKKNLPDDDLDKIARLLFNLIYDAVKVVAFAHEQDQIWSHQWVDLMFQQGSERYIEFNQRLTGQVSIDAPPLKYPLSIHKALNLLDDIENTIRENENDKSFIRGQILDNCNELLQIKRRVAISISNKLKNLIDEQAVYVKIDWQEFCKQVLLIVQNGRKEINEEGEISIKSWA